ncbi:MAG: cupin domain-containing protein [Candidatus Heimdallarchaeota archaeon]|nr:cupin domain-containing protein [Candidatus Heimdallarchaeota archaeon]
MSDKIIIAPKLEKQDLSKIVKYQENSIVSKELIKKDTGSVSIFAFAEGEELVDSTVPFETFIHILDGKTQVNIGENSFELEQGETIIIPADITHSFVAVKPFKMMIIMIKELEKEGKKE